MVKSTVCGEKGTWVSSVATGKLLSPSGTQFPYLHCRESAQMGSWTPLLLDGRLRFFCRAAGASEITGKRDPWESWKLCSRMPFLYTEHKREEGTCRLPRVSR